MKHLKIALASVALLGLTAATPAAAEVVSLNFENVNSTYPSANFAQILDFYNGGLSSDLTSGTNYGVSFGSNALV